MTIQTLFAVFSVILTVCSPVLAQEQAGGPQTYSYTIVNTYPHDPQAFTQGLVWDNGVVYEGTGLFDKSSLRRIDLKSGDIEQKLDYSRNIFCEGITIWGDTVYQLTWKNGLVFVYNKHDFSLVKTYANPRQGWGITNDNLHLIVGDGSANLYFLDPETFAEKRKITVHNKSDEVQYLNELEYIEGRVYANIYKSDRIAIINPHDGQVEGWINLAGLREQLHLKDDESVINGIMYNAPEGRLFVTGKLWPTLFEIKLIPEK